MDLESVIQSEVSQKENKIPYAICGIYMESKKKKVLMNLVAGQE